MTSETHDKARVAAAIVEFTTGEQAALNDEKVVTSEDAANRSSDR